jgi:beta-glucosidase
LRISCEPPRVSFFAWLKTTHAFSFSYFVFPQGYKHYHKTGIKPLFDFRVRDRTGVLIARTTISNSVTNSHGLSYTTFQYSDLRVSEPTYTDGDMDIAATLRLTNTGSVTGSEAVQLYVTLPATAEYTHPPLQLKAFKKVKDLPAGGSKDVTLKLDKYAVSYWDEKYSTWNVDKGVYTVRVGGSSANESLVLSAQFEVSKSFTWNGL